MPVELESRRLRLVKFREDHREAYAAMCADPEIMRYLGTGATLSATWSSSVPRR